jgi:4-amino-4-deoxy-L-arabinose transferase-like glycosyltransferase
MDDGIKRRALPWIGLCCILVMYFVSVLRFSPAALFGTTEDDSLYFSSAKAIANQQGYILPSVPGTPVATKYPILYPWILSWVWRWNPSFPSNLTGAVALTAAFGVVFLVSCFLFLRRLKGIGDSAALLLTFFTALHPVVLYYSANVLSDIPFAALAFTAMLAADQAMRPNAVGAKTAGCAILTGLSILMRAFGIPVAAGILAAAAARRAWRQIVIFCGVLAPFGAATVWRWVFTRSTVPPGTAAVPRQPGFVGVWTYYTSYQGFWKLSVPNAHILWAMLKNNAIFILHSPSDYFLAPLLTRHTIVSLSLMFLVTAGIFSGMVRQSQDRGWKSIHWVLPFYMALILVWNFPDAYRYSLLFLPLFAGGLWFEAKHFLTITYTTITKSQARIERTLAGILAFGVVALICALAWNYVRGARRVTADIVNDRSILLVDKREAYQWLSCCTSRDAVVIAYEDASLYLYSNRQSIRPIAFPTSGEIDPAYFQEALTHITDVSHVTGARYWLFADDDFDLEYETAASLGRAREMELEQKLPVIFQSRNGHVRIYKIGCDQRSKGQLCP